MPYGSPEQVADLATLWTDDGEFKDPDLVYDLPGTSPTLSTVELWLEQVSDLMDLALAQSGFRFPVTPDLSTYAEKAIRILDLKVSAFVADLVHLRHDTGRLFQERFRESGEDASSILERELNIWVSKRINSLEGFGIPRTFEAGEEGSSYSVPSSRQA